MDENLILLKKAENYGYRAWFSKTSSSFPNYSLKKERMVTAFDDAILEANNIDCIWFDGDKRMPSLFKICKANIIEGLFTLNNLKELIPPYYSKYFLIVDDSNYQTALSELSKPTFCKSGIIILKNSELIEADLT